MENMQAFVLDVFCSDSATGNPAAVCALTVWPDDLMLQAFAAAQSAPVTVFIILPPAQATPQPIPVRWFAGRHEINLCGHGSLAAAAFVLVRQPQWQQVLLVSRFGDIIVERSSTSLPAVDEETACFDMSLPAWPAQRPLNLADVVKSLNLSAQDAVLTDAFATRDLVLVLETAAQVQAFEPDFALLSQLQPYHATILTAPLFAADGVTGIGYGLRYFAPGIGINEDLATGSAQCSLAPYWLEQMQAKRLHVEQWSGGGGYFQVQLQNSAQILLRAAVRQRR